MDLETVIGFFVFVGIVLAFVKYKFDANPVAWAWEKVLDAWDRVRR